MQKLPKNNDEIRNQYFEQKKIEFTADCANNNATACFSLGEWCQMVAKDVCKAATIDEENCFKRNHGNSCANLARIYFSKFPDLDKIISASKIKELQAETDRKDKALFLFKQACEVGKSNPAFTSYATMKLYDKELTKKDFDKNIQVLEHLCDEETDVKACFKAGSTYISPSKRLTKFTEKQPEKALKYLKKGCDYGSASSCQILAVMYRKGDGVEKNDELFKKYRDQTIKLVNETAEKVGNIAL